MKLLSTALSLSAGKPDHYRATGPNKLPGLCLAVILATILTLADPAAAAGFPGAGGIPVPPSSQATFEVWLSDTGKPVYSRYHGYPASYRTWCDYKLLVYGQPSQVPGNRYDSKTGQYASLGFSYDEIVVTNSLFRDDSPDGKTKTTPWQWQELNMGQSAAISWARLDARQKLMIKNAVLTYRNNSYGNMTFGQLGLSEAKTVVLAQPSWHLGFALYTTHYLPGSKTNLRYATFNGNGGGDVSVAGSIDIQTPADANGRFVIGSQADYIDIQYTVSGSISSFSGLAGDSDVSTCGAGNAAGWVKGLGRGPWSAPLVFRVSRQDLAGASERSFTLTGQAWVVSRLGDIRLIQMEKTIVVRAESVAPPFEAQVKIKGSIQYFSGQTNSQGLYLPFDPHRFLALERLTVSMDFTPDPSSVQFTFNGQTTSLHCSSGIRHYEASLIIPDLPSTLAWDGRRLKEPLSLLVKATDRTTPARTVEVNIQDIEMTGNVYDITFAQISP
jgi:hypothetical protein